MGESLGSVNTGFAVGYGFQDSGEPLSTKRPECLSSQASGTEGAHELLSLRSKPSTLKRLWFALRNPLFFFRSDEGKMAISSGQFISYLEDKQSLQKFLEYIDHTPMTDEECINLLKSAIYFEKNRLARYMLNALSTETINASDHLFNAVVDDRVKSVDKDGNKFLDVPVKYPPITDKEYIKLLKSAISFKKNRLVRYVLDVLSTETISAPGQLFEILNAVKEHKNTDAINMIIHKEGINIFDIMNNLIVRQNEYLSNAVVQQCTDDQLKSVDQDGNTLLHVAVKYPNSYMVEALIKKRNIIDVNAKNNAGKNPLQLANQESQQHHAQLLEKYGAERDRRSYDMPWGYMI